MVKRSGPPPPELALAWECRRYNALPDVGGVLDQDYGLLKRMDALYSIHKAYEMYRSAKGEQINHLPGWVGANVAYLLDLGIGVGLDG